MPASVFQPGRHYLRGQSSDHRMAARKNKRAYPPDSIPPKAQDKRAKEGPDEDEDTLCITCKKNAERESIECEMCFKWEHRACTSITSEEYNLSLSAIVLNSRDR